MENIPTLPDHLIYDNILHRVPPKTIGACRCVSPKWRSMLSTPEFSKSHLNSMKKLQPEGILFGVYPGPTCYCSLDLDKETGAIISKWFDERNEKEDGSLSGTCNGLVLGVYSPHSLDLGMSLKLFNPITLDSVSIPHIPNTYMYGLGYDRVVDDYKILAITMGGIGGLFDVSLFSFKHQNWRCLGPTRYKYFSSIDGYFFNGGWHYIAAENFDGKQALVAFHLDREEFMELPFPVDLGAYGQREWGTSYAITVIRGCLAVVIRSSASDDVWIMREYGVPGSWEKFKIDFGRPNCFLYFLGVLGNDNLVYKKGFTELVVVSLGNCLPKPVTRYDGVHGIETMKTCSYSSRGFTESLICPNNL